MSRWSHREYFFWKPPLSFTIHRGGETLAAERGLGGDSESWPRLCEDLEANQKTGKTAREGNRPPGDCTRWATIWEGIPRVPERRAILEEMARYRFRPVPVHLPLSRGLGMDQIPAT